MKKQRTINDKQIKTEKSSFLNSFKFASGRLLLAFCISFFAFSVSAQEVKELSGLLNGNTEDINHLRSLVNDIQPTFYFQQSELIGDKGEMPTLIDTDVASVNQLYKDNPAYSSVEIIRIRISSPEDLNLILDISRLSAFLSLKYVYFLCDFKICGEQSAISDCEIGKIAKMISPEENRGITFIYLISIPS